MTQISSSTAGLLDLGSICPSGACPGTSSICRHSQAFPYRVPSTWTVLPASLPAHNAQVFWNRDSPGGRTCPCPEVLPLAQKKGLLCVEEPGPQRKGFAHSRLRAFQAGFCVSLDLPEEAFRPACWQSRLVLPLACASHASILNQSQCAPGLPGACHLSQDQSPLVTLDEFLKLPGISICS